jgi:hypothetical protein
MAKKKSWKEKRDSDKPHEVKRVPRDMMGMKAGQMMLIATPRIIEEYIRAIPEGEKVEVPDMRADLAKKYKAEVTCPVTTGIFLRIVTEAANEDYEAGTPLSNLPPVWRVIDEKTPLVKKLEFDPAYMLDMGAAERKSS